MPSAGADYTIKARWVGHYASCLLCSYLPMLDVEGFENMLGHRERSSVSACMFFSGKRARSLSVVYRIRVCRIRERTSCHQDTCVPDLPLALGKTQELLPSERCILQLVVSTLSGFVAGDTPRFLELACQQLKDHEASELTTKSST